MAMGALLRNRKVRAQTWLVLLLTVAGIHFTDGYSSGAPDAACSGMIPRHGPNAQDVPAPYTLTPLQTNVQPGGNVTLRLESVEPGGVFRGFMVQAIDPASSKPHALGTFFVNQNSRNSKILTCSPGFQNTLSHGDAQGKNSLEVNWQSPTDFQGDVEFRSTWVKDYSTFWVSVPSKQRVRVARAAPSTQAPSYLPTAAPAPTTYSRNFPNVSSTTPQTTSSSTTARIVSSTTPKVITQQWNFPTQAPPSTAAQIPSIYDGCGHTKGCFGLFDSLCVNQGNCAALVTYAVKGSRYEFELWAPNTSQGSYIAFGLSSDDKMGDDSVTECTVVGGKVNAFMSYNDGKSNVRLTDPSRGMKVLETRYSDGNLYCRLERLSPFNITGKTYDLSQQYFVMIARGAASEAAIKYHDRQKTVSKRSVNFAELSAVESNKGTLIKIHGAFMVTAWMLAASCGILFARYFRMTWVGKQFMGKDLWFVFHRALMILTWTLTIAAFIVIFIELGGWTSIPASNNPHAVIGVITTVLAFIQPIMAYFRPHPGTAKRFVFNWAHWLVGNAAHILAIVCIFLAVDLDKAAIPYWVNWLLVTYLAVHAFTHTVLSLAQCCFHSDGSRKSAAVFAMRDLAPHQNGQNHFYSTQPDRKEDAHGSKFRRVMLFFYILFVGSFSIAVIGTIAVGPWAD